MECILPTEGTVPTTISKDETAQEGSDSKPLPPLGERIRCKSNVATSLDQRIANAEARKLEWNQQLEEAKAGIDKDDQCISTLQEKRLKALADK